MSDMQRFRTFADFYPFYLGEHIHRMGRHAHHITRASFQDPVERRLAGRRIVDHQLHAGRHRLRHGDRADVVAHRAEREQDSPLVVAPVRDHAAGVREQRVVGMHDALRRAGGA